MNDAILVHQSDLEINGERCLVDVYCRPDGSHYAKTCFTHRDIIISDGHSLDDALDKHKKLLPLAVGSRRIIGEFRGISTFSANQPLC